MSTLGEPLSTKELHELIRLGLHDDQSKINIDCKINIFLIFILIYINPCLFILDLLDQLLGDNV